LARYFRQFRFAVRANWSVFQGLFRRARVIIRIGEGVVKGDFGTILIKWVQVAV
jgi:hypothetical protein